MRGLLVQGEGEIGTWGHTKYPLDLYSCSVSLLSSEQGAEETGVEREYTELG